MTRGASFCVQWNLELKAMLERHFKMKTAPKGAVEFA